MKFRDFLYNPKMALLVLVLSSFFSSYGRGSEEINEEEQASSSQCKTYHVVSEKGPSEPVPSELKMHICAFLDEKSLVSVSHVSHIWRAIAFRVCRTYPLDFSLRELDKKTCHALDILLKHRPYHSVSLRGVTFTDKAGEVLTRNFRKIKSLNLDYSTLSDQQVDTLFNSGLRFLKSLSIQNNERTFTRVKAIQDLYRLTSLKLTGHQINSESAQDIVKSGLSLTFLDLSQNTITDEAVTAIAQHCPNLTSLDLSWNDLKAENTKEVLFQALPKLISVYLFGNPLGGKKPRITSLNLVKLS